MGVTVVTRKEKTMAQIRIDDEVYDRLKEAADFNKRTVGQHILFLLDNELTFNDIRGLLAGQTVPTATLQEPNTPPVLLADIGKAIKKAKKLALDDLTEKDLATAKVTFEERPDFKEPDEWDKHAWPTV